MSITPQSGIPISKSATGTRKNAKAKAKREATKEARHIRALCVARDGLCRIAKRYGFADCYGPSEWAHLGDKRRHKTRQMAPSERHTTTHSVMLCRGHHLTYDAHVFDFVLGPHGANEELTMQRAGKDIGVC